MHIHELLPAGARPAIERALARPLSYTAQYVVTKAEPRRAVVVLGEAHMKLAEAAALGKGVVSKFELRGVETFQRKQVFLGSALGVLIQAPRALLRVVTLGAMKGSTITEAKELSDGHTVELEPTTTVPLALHVTSVYLTALFSVFYVTSIATFLGLELPAWFLLVAMGFQLHLVALIPAYALRREPWAWLLHPAVALVTVRDTLMAEGTVRMLREHPEPAAAVVVMGRAHVSGYVRELVEKHGFEPAEL